MKIKKIFLAMLTLALVMGLASSVALADGETFKAVLSSTTSNYYTLTFYYDDQEHREGGNIVYTAPALPTRAEKIDDWPYYSKRDNIKSIVIDSSMQNYDGLESTAYMFTDIQYTTQDITGTEYLNTKNVTNMNFMFNRYGSYSFNMINAPNVTNWDTSNVESMEYMFAAYGCESTVLNFNLDLSGWNTASLSSCGDMFTNAGANAKEWKVTIPAKTGKQHNDWQHWYCGEESQQFFIAPPEGKYFTIVNELTLNPGEGRGGSGSATIVSGEKSAREFTPPTKTGYDLDGWCTESGTKVLDAEGNCMKNVPNCTNEKGQWTAEAGDITLYAHWLPHVAQIGNNKFVSLEAALKSASAGDTVEVIDKIDEDSFVEIAPNVTLNLNGHEVNVKGVSVFGKLIDSGKADNGEAEENGEEEKSGKLVLAKKNLVYNLDQIEVIEGGKYDGKYALPVWNETNGCYKFYKVTGITTNWCTDGKTYQFAPQADELEKIFAGDSQVEMYVQLKYINGPEDSEDSEEVVANYQIGPELMDKYIEAKKTEDNKCINVTFSGNITDMQACAFFKAGDCNFNLGTKLE